jgi:hypothetical protein
MTPPTQIERFPNDLAGPAIEYSGIYEDGWVADHSLVVLRRSTGAGVVTVKGMLLPTPSGSGTTVSVDIDGVAIRSEHHDPGTFAIDVDVPAAKRDRVAVGLRFSQVRPLSDEDRRPASAHLDYVGVTR